MISCPQPRPKRRRYRASRWVPEAATVSVLVATMTFDCRHSLFQTWPLDRLVGDRRGDVRRPKRQRTALLGRHERGATEGLDYENLPKGFSGYCQQPKPCSSRTQAVGGKDEKNAVVAFGLHHHRRRVAGSSNFGCRKFGRRDRPVQGRRFCRVLSPLSALALVLEPGAI